MATKKSSKVKSTVKSVPTEVEIRKQAEKIYHERIAKGIHGTSEEDWHKAEKLLKAGKK